MQMVMPLGDTSRESVNASCLRVLQEKDQAWQDAVDAGEQAKSKALENRCTETLAEAWAVKIRDRWFQDWMSEELPGLVRRSGSGGQPSWRSVGSSQKTRRHPPDNGGGPPSLGQVTGLPGPARLAGRRYNRRGSRAFPPGHRPDAGHGPRHRRKVRQGRKPAHQRTQRQAGLPTNLRCHA